MSYRTIASGLLLICAHWLTAQEIDKSMNEGQLTFEGTAHEGVFSTFPERRNTLERQWWKYARDFSRPVNMKQYYRTTIPSEVNGSDVDIVLLSKTQKSGRGSRFFLALDPSGIPKAKVASYQSQVKGILMGFKRHYYLSILQEDLKDLEKKAARASAKIKKLNGRSRSANFNELQQINAEIEHKKATIREVYVAFQ